MGFIRKNLPVIIIWLIVGLIFLLPIWFTPNIVTLNPGAANDILGTLGLLVFIAIILERALEVLTLTFREYGKQERALHLQHVTQMAETQGQTTEAVHAVDRAKMEVDNYSATTRKITLGLGLALGFIVGAIGIRVLEPLIQPESMANLGQVQVTIFRLVDVFLTGGVISGGSEGIHRIAKVFTSYMDRAARAGSGGSAPPAP
jgi:hypothetical protein